MRIVEVDNALLINSALIHRSNTNIDTVDNTTKIRTLNKTFGKKNIVNKLNATEKLNVNSQLLEPEMKQVISGKPFFIFFKIIRESCFFIK